MRRTLLASTLSVVMSGAGLLAGMRPASAELPRDYDPLPGTVSLNPGHVGAVGSQFTQD